MTIRDVLLPLFVEVILTFVLLFWMAAAYVALLPLEVRLAIA